jgi:23S rRNA (pseudouridine1915-N3)-methyltransferase
MTDVLTAEGNKLLHAAQGHTLIVALDERGEMWTSRQLASRLADWQTRSEEVALLVGGADGLSPLCLEAAHIRWSLSPLTFPHALVRIILAEQLYRAGTLLSNHPYHRD